MVQLKGKVCSINLFTRFPHIFFSQCNKCVFPIKLNVVSVPTIRIYIGYTPVPGCLDLLFSRHQSSNRNLIPILLPLRIPLLFLGSPFTETRHIRVGLFRRSHLSSIFLVGGIDAHLMYSFHIRNSENSTVYQYKAPTDNGGKSHNPWVCPFIAIRIRAKNAGVEGIGLPVAALYASCCSGAVSMSPTTTSIWDLNSSGF